MSSESPVEHDIYEVLRKIRYDLTAAQAKITEAFSLLNAMNLPLPSKSHLCACGIGFGSERTLALHRQNVHDGPQVPMSAAENEAS